jgi:transposase
MGFIQGAHRHEVLLFPERRDDSSAAENPVRFLDALVDHLALTMLGCQRATPAAPGRSAYNPAALLPLSLAGSLSRLRASRRLAQATPRHVALRWWCKTLRPAPKTMADCRTHNPQPRRQVWRECMLLWKQLDLCAGALVALAGSQCKAVNAKARNFTQDKRTHLLPQLDQRIEGDLQDRDGQDHQADAGTPGGVPSRPMSGGSPSTCGARCRSIPRRRPGPLRQPRGGRRASSPVRLQRSRGLRALVVDADFRDMVIRPTVQVVRAPSAAAFSRRHVAGLPAVAPLVAQVDDQTRETLLQDVSASLRPYVTAEGLALPKASPLVTAHT